MTRMTGPDCAVMCNLINTHNTTCTATTTSVSNTTCSSSHRNELHNSPVARDSAAAGAACPTNKLYCMGGNSVSKRHSALSVGNELQIQPESGDEQADAGRDCRNRLARPNSQVRTRTGKSSFSLFS